MAAQQPENAPAALACSRRDYTRFAAGLLDPSGERDTTGEDNDDGAIRDSAAGVDAT
jgi:hypothetical protein